MFWAYRPDFRRCTSWTIIPSLIALLKLSNVYYAIRCNFSIYVPPLFTCPVHYFNWRTDVTFLNWCWTALKGVSPCEARKKSDFSGCFFTKKNCINSLFERYIEVTFEKYSKKYLEKVRKWRSNLKWTGACRWWIGPIVYKIAFVILNWNRNNFYFVYLYAFSLYMNLYYPVRNKNELIFLRFEPKN